ncbi:MAG: DNA/RNA helicase domain-containing protein [Vulcanimicrobiaceae bacterium]
MAPSKRQDRLVGRRPRIGGPALATFVAARGSLQLSLSRRPGPRSSQGATFLRGFEFDYVGVSSEDLRYDWTEKAWVGVPSASSDNVVARAGPHFTDFVKNTYRVLLTRSMKLCYVYFVDKATERFVRSRMPSEQKWRVEPDSRSPRARNLAPNGLKGERFRTG